MASAEKFQKEARERFLGRYGVVGVGESEDAEVALRFLLEDWSPEAWRPIQEWARRKGVRVEYQVVGAIKTR